MCTTGLCVVDVLYQQLHTLVRLHGVEFGALQALAEHLEVVIGSHHGANTDFHVTKFSFDDLPHQAKCISASDIIAYGMAQRVGVR